MTQCNVSDGPFGPESHLMRADVDHYLFNAAKRHGAHVYEGLKVAGLEIGDDGADMRLTDGTELRAEYVIDATGRNSVLADKYSLREEPSRFRTDS